MKHIVQCWRLSGAVLGVLFAGLTQLQAQHFLVTNGNASGAGSLEAAINAANAYSAGHSDQALITFAAGVTTVTLPASNGPLGFVNGQLFINANVTIDGGAGVTIDGNHNDRIFFIAGGTVNINNLNLINGRAAGGNSYSGGGGAGLGGAIFVANGAGIAGSNVTLQTNLTLSHVTFQNNSAVGGSAGVFVGPYFGTAGGGMGGSAVGDGGGGIGNSAHGAGFSDGIGANGIFTSTGATRAGPGYLSAGGLFGGGGGSGRPPGWVEWPGAGGGGGIGGQPGLGPDGGSNAGAGGFGGGGGSAPSLAHGLGGAGGLGGGGGGGLSGGDGGFGGGGGWGHGGQAGVGGFGAGSATTADGAGGGLGAGGAVFVMNGANLSVVGGSLGENSVTGGSGANAGSAYGTGMFLLNTITLSATPGSPLPISDSIYANDTNPADLGTTTLPGLTIGSAAHPGGTVILTGTNLYYGTTAITNGATLQAEAGAGLPVHSPLVIKDGVFQFSSTGARDVHLTLGTVGGQMSFDPAGAGGGFAARGGNVNLIVNNGDPLVWGTTANFLKDGQTLRLGSETADSIVTLSNNLALGAGGSPRAVKVHAGNTAVIAGQFTGSTGLVLNDVTHSGTLVLSQANFSGGATINGGALVLSGNSNIAGSLNLAGAGAVLDIQSGKSLQDITDLSGVAGTRIELGTNGILFGTSNSTTFAGTISGSGGLFKIGSGMFTLSGSNSYGGTTRVEGGVLEISSDAALGGGSLEIVGSTLRTTGNMAVTRNVAISNATFDVANETYLMLTNLHGNGLHKTGSGYLTLTGTNNSYTGSTHVSGGFLKVENGVLHTSEVNLNSANFYLVDSVGVLGANITGSGTFARSGSGVSVLTGTVSSAVAIQIESGTLGFSRSDAVSYGGVISGGGSVHKLGSGTLTLSGTSAIGGALSVDEGTLKITGHLTSAHTSGIASTGTTAMLQLTGSGANWTSHSDTLIGHDGGTGHLLLSEGATASDTFSLVGRSAGSTGTVTVTGTGSVWTHSEGLVVGTGGTGSLLISEGGHVTNSEGILGGDAGSSGEARVTGAGSLWVSNSSLVVGSRGMGSLTLDEGGRIWVGMLGTGTVTLGGSDGAAGVLNIGAAAGQAARGAGTVQAQQVMGGSGSGPKVVNFNHTSEAYTFAPRLTGSLSLHQNAGVTVLTGSNTYTGGTVISGGTLRVADDARLGAVSGTLTMNGGTLETTGNILTELHVVLAADSTFAVSNETYLTIDSTISGPGGLAKTGTGYLTLVGAQTYTGETSVQGGFFKIESGSLASSSVDLSEATFYLANSTGVIGANITGSGIFHRGGAGTSILTGSVGAGVTTEIESGTLVVEGSIDGTATVLNGGTLGGDGVVGGAVTVRSGGTLSPGASPGQLTLMDSLTMEDGAILLIEFGGTEIGEFDQVAVQGLFTAGGTINLMVIDGFTPLYGSSFQIFNGATPGFDEGAFTLATNLGGGLSWDTSALQSAGFVTVVPEPSIGGLLVGAGAFLATRRRRALR